jgi:hypothetical protein
MRHPLPSKEDLDLRCDRDPQRFPLRKQRGTIGRESVIATVRSKRDNQMDFCETIPAFVVDTTV